MVQAWQKRESEQQEFIEELFERIIADSEGERVCDTDALSLASDLLSAVIIQLCGTDPSEMEPADPKLMLTLDSIEGFARTPEEAIILKRLLLTKLLDIGFHGAEANFLRQRVHEPERLYSGHKAMDEVDL